MSNYLAPGPSQYYNRGNGQLQNQNLGQPANIPAPQPNQPQGIGLQHWGHPGRVEWHQYRPVDRALHMLPIGETAEVAVIQHCIICGDEFHIKDLCSIECNHKHCRNCLRKNVTIALNSHPFRPARCCKVIAKETLRRFGALTDQELEQYEIKIQELTNPSGNLYCHSADCGAFIPTTNRKRRVGECVMCSKRTCRACKAKSHFGPCDKAKLEACKKAEDQVYRLAEQKGWKRCPNCLVLVQKEGGCNHMSCRCGQDFCYLCGQVYGYMPHGCRQQAQQAPPQQILPPDPRGNEAPAV